MFLQWMWFSMMLSSLLFACVTGSSGLMLTAALDGTKNAIEEDFCKPSQKHLMRSSPFHLHQEHQQDPHQKT